MVEALDSAKEEPVASWWTPESKESTPESTRQAAVIAR